MAKSASMREWIAAKMENAANLVMMARIAVKKQNNNQHEKIIVPRGSRFFTW
jgi:hypothetical protein